MSGGLRRGGGPLVDPPRVGDRWVALKTGDTLRIPKGIVHGARTGAESCRVMVCYDTGTRQMVPVADPVQKN